MNIEQKTITSVEVAEMVNKSHNELLKDIRRYAEQLGEVKIPQSDFFRESTYINSQNKELPCYNVTKKGCEFIGNKLTGIKGTEFTAKYINRFHDMENELVSSKDPLQLLELEFKAIKQVNEKVDTVNRDLQSFKQDMPLLGLECDRITTAVRVKGVNCLGGKKSNAYNDRSLRSKVYQDIHSQIKREFGVSTYKAIKRSQTDLALQKIKEYRLPVILHIEVINYNNPVYLAQKDKPS